MQIPDSEAQRIFSDEHPTPNNPPWGIGLASLVWVASVAFIVIVPIVFLAPYLVRQGVDLSDKIKFAEFVQTDSTAVLLQIIAVIPAHLLTLALAWAVVTKSNKFSFREMLGWKWNGFNIWICLAILCSFFIIAAAVSHFYPEQDNDLLKILRSSRAALYVVAFLATFTAPLVEEVVYRGVLYSALQKKYSVAVSVALVTLLFALIHVPQYYPSYSTIFIICLLSLTLTLVRVRTGNLLPCIALHTVFNGVQSLILVLEPYLDFGNAAKQAVQIIHALK